ncbi:hypothetical protein MKD49_05460 [Herbaspirillum sp. WGmk3]|uniref:hypothetical protein n=1 Tax=Herbaspirillum sp. WGmk3 TaxID=2919925 RepID=UPI002090C4F6|nr:hypothetical protein [Herbaspirillum sp. WGmk3]MCO4855929.1 hypothetical protein [Herbaspirillum sp. WGmk3]
MSMADVDLRGFEYPLAPLLLRHKWALEALQVSMARVLRKLNDLRSEVHNAEQARNAQQEHLKQFPQRYLDPFLRRRALDYLTHTREAISALQERVEAAQSEHKALLSQCQKEQVQIDLLEQHQKQQLYDYALRQRAKTAAAMNHEWIARSLWEDLQRGEAVS